MPTFPSPTSSFLTLKSLVLVSTGSSNFQVNITQLFHLTSYNMGNWHKTIMFRCPENLNYLCRLVHDISTSEDLRWRARRSALKDVVYVIHNAHYDVINNARAMHVMHHVIDVVYSCYTLRYMS